MATKKTWEWAKRKALLAYRKALKAAEKGEWRAADRLTNVGLACAFCQVGDCPRCVASRLCGKAPYAIAAKVIYTFDTPTDGIKALRSTIAQLEALDV